MVLLPFLIPNGYNSKALIAATCGQHAGGGQTVNKCIHDKYDDLIPD